MWSKYPVALRIVFLRKQPADAAVMTLAGDVVS
jgi:hypothetical protein